MLEAQSCGSPLHSETETCHAPPISCVVPECLILPHIHTSTPAVFTFPLSSKSSVYYKGCTQQASSESTCSFSRHFPVDIVAICHEGAQRSNCRARSQLSVSGEAEVITVRVMIVCVNGFSCGNVKELLIDVLYIMMTCDL